MDPNTPLTLMRLLKGDDSPQVGGKNAAPISAHNSYVSYPPYPPHNYHHYPHHLYYPPQLSSRIPSGSSQNPRPYHFPTYYESLNVHDTEYLYYPPYHPLPPCHPNYLSAWSNFTPSATATGSMVGLGHFETKIEPSTDEGDVEEVTGGHIGGAKRWTVAEDQRLIRAWVRASMNPSVGADQKKSSFWNRVASKFYEHRPQGASARTSKECSGRWLRCFPVVNKWTCIMLELERSNHSGWNDIKILQEAHRFYTKRTRKKFELEHWYGMLKDQPKWLAICDLPKLGLGSSKWSNPDTKEVGDEGAGGRKAAKRRLKEKVNNTIVDLVITQLKELNSTNTDVNQIFKDFIITVNEEKAQKMMRERKMRAQEDRIMMMDTLTMTPEQSAHYEQKRVKIMQRRSRHLSST